MQATHGPTPQTSDESDIAVNPPNSESSPIQGDTEAKDAATSQPLPEDHNTTPAELPAATSVPSTSPLVAPSVPPPATKRFSSANISKKFLQKTTAATPHSTSPATSASAVVGLQNGRKSPSQTPAATRPPTIQATHQSRLITTKLTSSNTLQPGGTSINPAAVGWSGPKPSSSSTGSYSHPSAQSPLNASTSSLASARNGPSLQHSAKSGLKTNPSIVAEAGDQSLGQIQNNNAWATAPKKSPANSEIALQDGFPTAAEAGRGRLPKPHPISPSGDLVNGPKVALVESADAFRGVHLDPNVHHWDEMEDDSNDFLGGVLEFGDGTQYTLPPSKPAIPGLEGPPTSANDLNRRTLGRQSDRSVDDYDRSWPPKGAQGGHLSAQTTSPRFSPSARSHKELLRSPAMSQTGPSDQHGYPHSARPPPNSHRETDRHSNDHFDRDRPTGQGERVLFNEHSNRLEPYSGGRPPQTTHTGWRRDPKEYRKNVERFNLPLTHSHEGSGSEALRRPAHANPLHSPAAASDTGHSIVELPLPDRGPRIASSDRASSQGHPSEIGQSYSPVSEAQRILHRGAGEGNLPDVARSPEKAVLAASLAKGAPLPGQPGPFLEDVVDGTAHKMEVQSLGLTLSAPPLSTPAVAVMDLGEYHKQAMHSAAERAKIRRVEEERRREEEKERARRKADELERLIAQSKKDTSSQARDTEDVHRLRQPQADHERRPLEGKEGVKSMPEDAQSRQSSLGVLEGRVPSATRPKLALLAPSKPRPAPHSTDSLRSPSIASSSIRSPTLPEKGLSPSSLMRQLPVAQSQPVGSLGLLGADPTPAALQSPAAHPFQGAMAKITGSPTRGEVVPPDMPENVVLGDGERSNKASTAGPNPAGDPLRAQEPLQPRRRPTASDYFQTPPGDTSAPSNPPQWRRGQSLAKMRSPSRQTQDLQVESIIQSATLLASHIPSSALHPPPGVVLPSPGSARAPYVSLPPSKAQDHAPSSVPAPTHPMKARRDPISSLDDTISRIKATLMQGHEGSPVSFKERVTSVELATSSSPARLVRVDSADTVKQTAPSNLVSLSRPALAEPIPSKTAAFPVMLPKVDHRSLAADSKKVLLEMMNTPTPHRWDILSWYPPVPFMSKMTLSRDETLFFPGKGKVLVPRVVLPRRTKGAGYARATRVRPSAPGVPSGEGGSGKGRQGQWWPSSGRISGIDEASWRKPTQPTAELPSQDVATAKPPPGHLLMDHLEVLPKPTPLSSSIDASESPLVTPSSPAFSNTHTKPSSRHDVAFYRPPTSDLVQTAAGPPLMMFTVNSELDETKEGAKEVNLIQLPLETAPEERLSKEKSSALLTSPRTQSSWAQAPVASSISIAANGAPDPEHLKAVWLQAPRDASTTENSLKGIADDFPGGIPFSMQDMKSEDGDVKSDRDNVVTPAPASSRPPTTTPLPPSRMSLHDAHRAFQLVPPSPSNERSTSSVNYTTHDSSLQRVPQIYPSSPFQTQPSFLPHHPQPSPSPVNYGHRHFVPGPTGIVWSPPPFVGNNGLQARLIAPLPSSPGPSLQHGAVWMPPPPPLVPPRSQTQYMNAAHATPQFPYMHSPVVGPSSIPTTAPSPVPQKKSLGRGGPSLIEQAGHLSPGYRGSVQPSYAHGAQHPGSMPAVGGGSYHMQPPAHTSPHPMYTASVSAPGSYGVTPIGAGRGSINGRLDGTAYGGPSPLFTSGLSGRVAPPGW